MCADSVLRTLLIKNWEATSLQEGAQSASRPQTRVRDECHQAQRQLRFEADVRGETVLISQVSHATEFYHAAQGSASLKSLMETARGVRR